MRWPSQPSAFARVLVVFLQRDAHPESSSAGDTGRAPYPRRLSTAPDKVSNTSKEASQPRQASVMLWP